MAQTIKIKRGLSANFSSATLVAGEPAFVTDTGKLYIGDGTSKVLINPDQSSTALSADKLTTPRTIALTGDVTGSVSFDGSGDVSIVTTEKNSGVTAGTYTKVTVNAKGDVTAGSAMVAGDIPTLTMSKISDAGTASTKNVGTASGNIPILDSSGKLDTNVLPAIAIVDTNVVASQTAMLALTAQVGDVAVRTDLNKTYILKTAGASTLTNWQELLTPTDAVASVAGKTGVVTLVSNDVGLGNVTNESKATMFTNPTFTGTITGVTPTTGDNSTKLATTAFVGTASTSGNAGTATRLATARTIGITGDVTGTATSFDGSSNIAINAVISVIDGGTF